MKKILISLSVVIGLLVISYVGVMTYGWIGIQKAVDPRKAMSADSSMERVEVTMKYKSIEKETVLFIPKSYFIYARDRAGGEQKDIVLRMYDVDNDFIPWAMARDREFYKEYKKHAIQLTIEAGAFESIKKGRIPNMMRNVAEGQATLAQHKSGFLKYTKGKRKSFELLPDKKIKEFYIYCGRKVIFCRYFGDYKNNIYYSFQINISKLHSHEQLNKRVRKLINTFELQ
jgi:hypothetical protein